VNSAGREIYLDLAVAFEARLIELVLSFIDVNDAYTGMNVCKKCVCVCVLNGGDDHR